MRARIVHAADLHIDSPLRGLERYEGAPVDVIRGATRKACARLIDLCLHESADLLLIAGDVFDGDWRDYSTGLFFAAQLSRLRDSGTRVVLVRGNHDAATSISRRLPLPEHVHELATQRPQTVVFEELGVAVHGQGFAQRVVDEDLAASYPDALAALANIGLLHTSLDGRPGHDPYAPTTLQVLRSKGYVYWALGHVHAREVVATDPWVVYAGNLQGRHVRETGPKGATVFTVADGRVVGTPEHHALDVVRWARCELDIARHPRPEDVLDAVRSHLDRTLEDAAGRTLAVRVVLTGRGPSHAALAADPDRWLAEARAMANDLGGEGVWIESLRVRTRSALDRAALREGNEAIEGLLASIASLGEDADALAELDGGLAELRHALPAEVRAARAALDLNEPNARARLLADVEQLLVDRLIEAQG